jgi:hypothetical protein
VRYGDRNASERMFCRLKDFRRIATRYDKLATNFRDAIRFSRSFWLPVQALTNRSHVVFPMRPLQCIHV